MIVLHPGLGLLSMIYENKIYFMYISARHETFITTEEMVIER